MKLSAITFEESGVLELMNPTTGEPCGATISLMSPENKDARKHAIEAERERRRIAARTKRQAPDDPETQRSMLLDRIAFMTIGWSGLEEDDGTPVVFSRERARAIYEDPALAWVRDQVMEFIGDRENFIARSEKTSSPTRARISS